MAKTQPKKVVKPTTKPTRTVDGKFAKKVVTKTIPQVTKPVAKKVETKKTVSEKPDSCSKPTAKPDIKINIMITDIACHMEMLDWQIDTVLGLDGIASNEWFSDKIINIQKQYDDIESVLMKCCKPDCK